MILKMPFLKINNANVAFGERTLTWKSYTTNKVLLTIKQIHLVDSKKFVITVLDTDSKTFIIYVAIRKQEKMPVYSKRQSQIGALWFDQALIEVLTEYFNYSDVFSAENAAELSEHTGINDHAIKLEEDKQPPFGPIYSLGLVELETLKTYIKTNLANGFIQPFKSPARASILSDKKLNRSLCLYVGYQSLNNITIKNLYLLLLIDESLNWLGWVKRFTQLDLINFYHQMRICEGNK